MPKWLRTKIARILAGLALAIALYALAGFVIAPKIVRHVLLKDLPETLGATVSVGEIRINPFLFKVEIDDFALTGKGADKLLGFGRLFIDFELSSLWHRAYTFSRIEIGAPFVSAAVAPDGSVNLAQLRPKPTGAAPPPPSAKNEPLPRLRIGSFKVTQGTVTYEDRSRPSQFAARLEPINFELKDFTTGVSGGLFTFTGASKLGERVEWHGHLSVQPIESDGEFRIEGLRAHTIWEYLEDQLNFVIDSGSIDLRSTYKFSLKDTIELTANVASVTMSDFALRPRDSDADWVSLPQLTLSGAAFDLARREAAVDSLRLSGLKLLTWLEQDGSLNLLKLSAPRGAAASPGAPTAPALHTAAGGAGDAPAPPWRFDLKQFELRDASISAEDRAAQPAAKVLLAPLSITVTGASLDLTKPVKVALDTRINEAGSLAASGEVTPQPMAAVLHLKLSGLDLTAAQPYLAQRTSMSLRSGKLGADAQLNYGVARTSAPASLQVSGDVFVENLHTVDDVLHDDFINWERVDVRGLNYQSADGRLDIAEIVARKPYARVIIESDTSLNVTRVLGAPGAQSAVKPPASPTGSAALPAPAKAKPARGPAAVPQSTAGPPMAIKKILVQGAKASFTDLSVKPNFSAGIQNLEGSVLGLSSKPNSRAKVDLHGNVDAFSPVSISGEVNVLSAALYTDLALDFRNMELSIFNPYSGKFAGYNITKGKLTTELHYKIDGRKLDATHHILIDQLEFGDKTASKNAVSLPVKLAVALLKDRNGVIDLNFPVGGTLDDPSFRLGPIIWKVIVNILEKAVTAPFALLGSLFGGGPDIQFIDFRPGSSAVDAGQSAKVQAIAKALKERPQLKLEVPIAAVPEVDGPALIGAAFDSQLALLQTQRGSRKKAPPDAPAPAFEQLDAAAKLDVLTQLYAQVFGAEPKYPDTVTAIKQKPELTSAKIDFLKSAVRGHLTVGDDQFKTLAQARALALQQALLTDTGVEPERVFLVVNDKAQAKEGAVRLELSLR